MLQRLVQVGIAFFITCTASLAAYCSDCFYDGPPQCPGPIYARGQTRIDLGYRQDSFRWSIAGPGGCPNILSELDWKKLHMLEANTFGWYSDPCIPYIRWAGAYSAIMRGSVSDRDFAADNRHLEFSRSKALCNQGSSIDLSAGLGWPFLFYLGYCEFGGLFQLAPVAGISWHQKHLHMHCGRQILHLYNAAEIGRIHGLHSEYRTHWWGPWIGVDAIWEWGPRWNFTGGYEYHFCTRYEGHGDWNLRRDFCGGFNHRANDGQAWIARFGGQFAFTCYWLFSFDLAVQDWRSGRGTDRTRLCMPVLDDMGRPLGIECVTVQTPFNGAHWKSYSLTAGLAFRY